MYYDDVKRIICKRFFFRTQSVILPKNEMQNSKYQQGRKTYYPLRIDVDDIIKIYRSRLSQSNDDNRIDSL